MAEYIFTDRVFLRVPPTGAQEPEGELIEILYNAFMEKVKAITPEQHTELKRVKALSLVSTLNSGDVVAIDITQSKSIVAFYDKSLKNRLKAINEKFPNHVNVIDALIQMKMARVQHKWLHVAHVHRFSVISLPTLEGYEDAACLFVMPKSIDFEPEDFFDIDILVRNVALMIYYIHHVLDDVNVQLNENPIR